MGKKNEEVLIGEETYFPPRWSSFLDEYIANGFKGGAAYMKVYSASTKPAAQVGASRLLRKAKIREEIKARLVSQSITNAWILSRLKTIAQQEGTGYANASVRATTLLARATGMLSVQKQPEFAKGNPAVFLAPYTKEESEAFEQGMVRFCQ
jgi:hypothetical protein